MMLSIIAFSIPRLNIVTFVIMVLTMTLSIKDTQHNNSKHSSIQYNNIGHTNNLLHNAQHNEIQCSEIKHDDIWNNGPNCDTQYQRHSAQQQ
jgi:hypothetical protein